MLNVEKLKGKFSGLKNSSFLLAFLVLAIYMLDRAIGAIIYPDESMILTQMQQSDGSELYLIELSSVTSYATNSILFPTLLLIFYRLAKGNKMSLLLIPITLHYLSVIIVSTYFLLIAAEETSEYLLRLQVYESDVGERFRFNENFRGLEKSDGKILSLLQTEEGRYFYVESGEEHDAPEESRVYLKEVDGKLSLTEYAVHYYSPLMALFFVFLSVLGLWYCFRLNLDELFESEKEKKDNFKERIEAEE